MDFLSYLNDKEESGVSFAKLGSNSKNLIICFGGNHHDGFERKTSLVDFKNERGDFDILYLRDRARWYLNNLCGIGTKIEDTIQFLKSEIGQYEKTICVGISSGGYASILFSGLCGATISISEIPQTNLRYCTNKLPYILNKLPKNESFDKYCSLDKFIFPSVTYYTSYRTEWIMKDMVFDDEVLHGFPHYKLIQSFDNVKLLNTTPAGRLSAADFYMLLSKCLDPAV